MGFAARMEVFPDDAWYTFDPRDNRHRIGRIFVTYRRDAADLPLMHSFGPHSLVKFQVWTDEVAEGGSV